MIEDLKKPAIFIDRDGTIIEDKGVISTTKDIELFPFSISALHILQKKYLLFIVTNQSGISLGKVSKEEVLAVNTFLVELLRSHGIAIQKVYCCGHKRDDMCECIKPKPYFIQMASMEFNINKELSYSIGDHPHDVEFGKASGGNGLYVLTGHGKKHLHEVTAGTRCFENILEIASWLTLQ